MSGVGGDMSETVVCPGCGDEVCNTRWPRHYRSEDCESGESQPQRELDEWREGQ